MNTLELVLPWISTAVGLAALYGFFDQRKKVAMSEGQRNQEFFQLRKDLDHAYEKLHALEEGVRCTENDLTEVRTDIKHILAALGRIEDTLKGRA